MKRALVLIPALLFTLLATNVAAQEPVLEEGNMPYTQLETALNPLLNQDLPEPFSTVYGNEQIDFYLGDKTNNTVIGHIRTSQGKFTEIGRGTSDKTSLRIYIRDKEVVEELVTSDSPFSEFRQMKKDNKIKIEAVGTVNKIKNFFVSLASRLIGLFI